METELSYGSHTKKVLRSIMEPHPPLYIQKDGDSQIRKIFTSLIEKFEDKISRSFKPFVELFFGRPRRIHKSKV